MRRHLPARLATGALLLALVPAVPVQAQGIIRGQQPQQAVPQAAPALPGLAARRAPAPIQADPNANLSPNAALFDAIARGDIAAARDAVARGANLEARNALGLTPLDAAVDQGRNDIAFYLLSARDLSRGPVVSSVPSDSTNLAEPPTAPAPRGPARREVPAAARANPAASAAAAALAAEANQPAAVRGARLWAGDGGTPRPEIGFLGFDAGRPAGAEPPPLSAPPARRNGRS